MNRIKAKVKEAYSKIAKGKSSGCCGPEASCGCGGADNLAKAIGYSSKDINGLPEGSNLGLGCGNPTALAALKKGETVLDLGSGAGLDCFLAAKKVGPKGKIIGVDMTPEMIKKARANALKAGALHVEFRLGEIERLPLDDNSVDVVISNCVINLSADKPKVFREILRVLKPGGRIAISDIALRKDLPSSVKKSPAAYSACIAGALPVDEYKKLVKEAGFKKLKFAIKPSSSCIVPDTKDPFGQAVLDSLPAGVSLENHIASINVEGQKP